MDLKEDILCFLSFDQSLKDLNQKISYVNFRDFMVRFHNRFISYHRYRLIQKNI